MRIGVHASNNHTNGKIDSSIYDIQKSTRACKENAVSRTKRVGIIMYDYILAESATLVYTAIELAEQGYNVDIFINTSINDREVFKDYDNIKVYSLPYVRKSYTLRGTQNLGANLCQRIKRLAKSGIPRIFIRIYSSIKLSLKIFTDYKFIDSLLLYSKRIDKILKKHPYICFLAIEPEGLIPCGFLCQKYKLPFIYLSLELNNLLWEKKRHRFKALEIKYNHRAIATITQDEERANILRKDNKLRNQEIILMPISARGSSYTNKHYYFHNKFSLSRDKKIILHAGSIAFWASCIEIAEAALHWNKNWVLVFHGPRHFKDYLEKLVPYTRRSDNIKISLDWLPYDRLNEIIASGDIGIAIYQGYCLNNRLIGSASGKIAHYLQCGIPTITNDFPSLKRIVNVYKCGECVSDVNYVNECIRKILNNYEEYRENAFMCYEQRYNFSNNFKKVISKVNSLVG